jgi:hypothetical protein
MIEDKTLENFMKEHFPFKELKGVGFFTKEMKGDYKAQAERVRKFFGYKTVYEYGAEEVRCHISYSGNRPLTLSETGVTEEPFITVKESIYE